MERNTTVRTCGAISTRRTFIFMFHQRLLAAPLLRQNSESAPLFFSRRNGSTWLERRKRERMNMTTAEQLIAKWTEFEASLKGTFRDYDKKDAVSFLKAHHIEDIDVQQIDSIRNIRNAVAHPCRTADGKPFFVLNEEIIPVLDEAIRTVKSLPKVANVLIPLEKVQICRLGDGIKEVVARMIERSHSNVPVLSDENLVIGVLSESVMLRIGMDMMSAKHPKKIRDIMEYLILGKRRPDRFFFVNKEDPIVSLCQKCHDATKSNKRAEMFLVTKDGARKGELKGIVTVWDFVEMMEFGNERDRELAE